MNTNCLRLFFSSCFIRLDSLGCIALSPVSKDPGVLAGSGFFPRIVNGTYGRWTMSKGSKLIWSVKSSVYIDSNLFFSFLFQTYHPINFGLSCFVGPGLLEGRIRWSCLECRIRNSCIERFIYCRKYVLHLHKRMFDVRLISRCSSDLR